MIITRCFSAVRQSRPAAIPAAVLFACLILGTLRAQTPAQAPATRPQAAPAAARDTRTADRLPVRRVVLYKSGVGYFEHLGKVRGNQAVTIDFTSGQLDDVLKSLTTLDLDGGRVSGVSYNTEAALDRRLESLRLPVGEVTTRAAFFSALRGARLEVHSGGVVRTGRLLSVERLERRGDSGTVTSIDALSIVSDAGEITTVALDPGVTVRIAEADLNTEVGRYLSLVASVRDQDLRRLTISATGTGERDLFVSYVSEVPVWKATYRLVLPAAADARRPLLQGWAIVDNTVGEDWDNVELSLVAGAPQSFIQTISHPLYAQRPIVPMPGRFLQSPQTHQSSLGTAGPGVITGTVADTSGGLIPGATVRVTRAGTNVGTAVTDANGRYRLTGLPAGAYDVAYSTSGFQTQSRSGITVNGGMETVVNVSLQVGGISEGVAAQSGAGAGRGGGGGRGGGPAFRSATGTVGGIAGGNVMLDGISEANVTEPPPIEARIDAARLAQQTQTDAQQLGDLFEYKLTTPVTIRKNQSALVPIVSSEVNVDRVSLWNASSGSRPLRAVWLTNTSNLTLDGGSFSVVDGQTFAGEGLLEPLKAGERRLLSYATDLAVVVDTKLDVAPRRTTKVQIARGVVIQQTEDRQTVNYTARNEDTEPRVLVIEHPVRAGWTVSGTVTPVETTAAWYRYRVTIAPKTSSTFSVTEARPVQSQFSVSNVTDDQITLLVRDRAISPEVQALLRQVIERKNAIAALQAQITAREQEIGSIGRDQDRVRGNMQALKGSSEEKQLLQRYVKQLDDQENRLAVLRKEVNDLTADRNRADADLSTFIQGLSAGGT